MNSSNARSNWPWQGIGVQVMTLVFGFRSFVFELSLRSSVSTGQFEKNTTDSSPSLPIRTQVLLQTKHMVLGLDRQWIGMWLKMLTKPLSDSSCISGDGYICMGSLYIKYCSEITITVMGGCQSSW